MDSLEIPVGHPCTWDFSLLGCMGNLLRKLSNFSAKMQGGWDVLIHHMLEDRNPRRICMRYRVLFYIFRC